MIIDNCLHEIKRYLDELSQLIPVCYEIRNCEGQVVIASWDAESNGVDPAAYKELYSQVMASQRPRMLPAAREKCIWGVPLQAKAETLEAFVTITLDAPPNGLETQEDAETPVVAFICNLLQLVVDHQEQEKELADFTTELSTQYEHLSFIYEIEEAIGHVADDQQTFNYILQKACDLIDADLVMMQIPSKKVSAVFHVAGTPPEMFDNEITLRNATSFLIDMMKKGYAYLTFSDMRTYADIMQWFKGYNDLLAIPVVFDGKIEGTVLFGKQNLGSEFTIGDKRMITVVSDIISIVLTNSELFKDLNQFLLNLMKSFVTAIEEKDPYTRGHSERVNVLSLKMGEAMGLDAAEMKLLNYAALLHDVGKIGIAEAVLNKPSKLTDEEYEVIKHHPLKGNNILAPIKQLQECLPGILYHHERMDGRGYPLGMSGEDIPLIARIIAVADVYDAMTSSRAYRNALSSEVTVQELQRVSGTQLDPEIVKVFLKNCIEDVQSKQENQTAGEVSP